MDTSKNVTQATLIIADDHTLVRQGTAKIAADIQGLELVGEADNGLSAIALVKKHKPDLLILDAAMPMARGIEVYAECRRWSPSTKVLLQTGFTSGNLLSDWLSAGVDGVLLKTCTSDEIEHGIREVLAGRAFVAKEAIECLDSASVNVAFTDRERQVLALLATGHTNAMIGERLMISSKTVEKHRAGLMSKLGVNTVAELLVCALREGLLDEHKQL